MEQKASCQFFLVCMGPLGRREQMKEEGEAVRGGIPPGKPPGGGGPPAPGMPGNGGGGIPPGKPKGGGKPPPPPPPPPGWFCGSMGLAWAWPSAAYDDVMESMTDWAFSCPISAGAGGGRGAF